VRLHAVVADPAVAARALAGGATVVQLRLKGRPTAEVVSAGRPVRELCRERGARFIVNDDVEAALELEADGVHLGREDSGAELAREAGLLLGLSASDLETALAAAGSAPAYVGLGPVWATPTKPDAGEPLGLDGLAAVCAAVSVPIVAIGGIDASNAAACVRAGAVGVAVVRAAADAAAVRKALDGADAR